MAAINDDDPGFWPGYVAAVSGLVQGLLIMAMALGAAIFALGQLARLPAPRPSAAPAQAAGRPPVAAVVAAPLPVPPSVDVSEQGPAPLAPPPALQRDSIGDRITAGFEGDAVVLPASAVPGLVQRIAQARVAGVTRWRISITADIANPRDQRAAYLRLMGLRNLFVRQGVSPVDVDLWIDSTVGISPPEAEVATIVPLDAGLADRVTP